MQKQKKHLSHLTKTGCHTHAIFGQPVLTPWLKSCPHQTKSPSYTPGPVDSGIASPTIQSRYANIAMFINYQNN
jgi:hypothetical protein